MRHRHTIISTITTHDRHGIGIADDFRKRISIQVTQLSLPPGHISTIQTSRRCTMSHKMFGHCAYAFRLRTTHEGSAHLANQERVFTESLFHTPPTEFTRNVEHRTLQLPDTYHMSFPADGFGHILHQIRVESGPLRNSLWKYRAPILQYPIDAFHGNQGRNPPRCPCTEMMLEFFKQFGCFFRRLAHLMYRTCTLLIMAFHGINVTVGIVLQLQDLLMQSHAPQQIFHPFFHGQ